MGRARLWREGKLRCAKPFKFNLADVARLKVAQTGKGTAGHKLIRTYPYGRPHHLRQAQLQCQTGPPLDGRLSDQLPFAVDDEHHFQFRRDFSVGHHASLSSGGSPHLSAICWQTFAISVRTSNTTRSMLRLIARSPRGAHRAGRLDNAVRVTPACRR